MKIISALSVSLAVLTASPSFAQTLEAARSAYDAGDWATAEQAADQAPVSIEALILAADAALAPLTLGQMEGMSRRDRRDAAVRAQIYAMMVLELEPDNVQGHLRSAAGLGYEGRYVSRLRALTGRLPQRSRDHMQQAMALDPSDPWGPAMLGAWHMEVVRRTSSPEGMFGSNEAEGLALMRQAAAMQDVPAAVTYRIALALVASNAAAHAEEAGALLQRAQDDAGPDASDQAVHALAQTLANLLVTPENAQAEAIRRLDE